MDRDEVDLNQLLDGAHMLQHLTVQALFKEDDQMVAITQPPSHLKTHFVVGLRVDMDHA